MTKKESVALNIDFYTSINKNTLSGDRAEWVVLTFMASAYNWTFNRD